MFILVEPDALGRRVRPVAVGAERVPENAAVPVGPGSCLNIRPLPRVDDFWPILACLPNATPLTLPGETATDASGNDWIYAEAGDIQGWVSADFIEIAD